MYLNFYGFNPLLYTPPLICFVCVCVVYIMYNSSILGLHKTMFQILCCTLTSAILILNHYTLRKGECMCACVCVHALIKFPAKFKVSDSERSEITHYKYILILIIIIQLCTITHQYTLLCLFSII